jgi:asparagine synthase (glutamine-hydrolysing)
MLEAIRHESFYNAGTWVDEAAGVYVGWTAKRGSFSDGMPICNERGDVVLVFSGEDFPEPGTAQRLRGSGHDCALEGPSYLVHSYEEDPQFFKLLNGRFHGLLVDRNQGTATLFNDRYGLGRVYYHEDNDGLYFAAEAKAILAVRPNLRRLSVKSLGEFISCGCVLENRSLFDGISVLPSGSAWICSNRAVTRRETYFQPQEWENQEQLAPEDYYQQLKDVFTRKLPQYFNGREPVGMSLTGGLDTRMIMAWEKVPPSGLPCYSFGSEFRDCQDVSVARRVAQECGQPHNVIPVGKDLFSRFPQYAERAVYYTDGCVEAGRASDLYVNERVREIAPVRMTGNYGGEVLRRVRAFKPLAPLSGLFQPEVVQAIDEATCTYRYPSPCSARHRGITMGSWRSKRRN